jgi:polysaccharide export outer membrane protein
MKREPLHSTDQITPPSPPSSATITGECLLWASRRVLQDMNRSCRIREPRMILLRRFLVCGLLGLLAFLVAPQPLPAADAPPVAAPAAAAPADGTAKSLFVLGAGDSVKVSVFGQPDMAATEYVGDDGSINLSLVGAVKVAGLTPVEAAKRIEATLVQRQLLVSPHVTLTVEASHSQRVSVLGQVKAPARYAIDPNTSIFDLLSQAGGTLPEAASVIFILRKDAAGVEQRIPIDLKALADQGGQASSQLLQSGDSVYIPKAPEFYVYGEVKAPGKYRIDPGLTVVQAIALAGGITDRGSTHRVVIERKNAAGTTDKLSAHLDDPVQVNDVIRVKESIF